MSLDATRWAWLQQGLRPIQKLVLLALADRADADNRAFPSYDALRQDTGADRKTIWAALKALQALGLIRDTGERKGRTASIVVWELVGVELREQAHKQFRKRNGSKNGTVPFLDSSSSKNGMGKQFQKRNMEPTNREPTKEPLQLLPTTVVNTTQGVREETEVDRGGGCGCEDWERERTHSAPLPGQEECAGPNGDALIYPARLSPEEVLVADRLLQRAPKNQRQDILDELAGLIEMGLIRKSDLGVLRGLVEKAKQGEFVPDLALKIQRGRRAREKIQCCRERSKRQIPQPRELAVSGIEAFKAMNRILGKPRR